MQGTPRVPLVRRTGFGVIDRQANFIPAAFDASSFLFPIRQWWLLDETWSIYLRSIFINARYFKILKWFLRNRIERKPILIAIVTRDNTIISFA